MEYGHNITILEQKEVGNFLNVCIRFAGDGQLIVCGVEHILHSVFILEQILIELVCGSLSARTTETPMTPSADQLATVPRPTNLLKVSSDYNSELHLKPWCARIDYMLRWLANIRK